MLTIEEDDKIYVGDEILQEFHNCLSCGLCCKFFDSIPVYEEEIEHILPILDMKKTEFKKTYTKHIRTPADKEKVSLKTPCSFQKGNICTIHDNRWFICRTFPLCINITKNIAILSGIYVCPQATQFYEAMLAFYRTRHPKVYEQFLEKEKHLKIDRNGMKIMGPAIVFSCYLDWLHSKETT